LAGFLSPSSRTPARCMGRKKGLHEISAIPVAAAIARRARVDPATVWLHKRRATYCVELMREGVDLPSVQRLMGHKDLQTTARYCAPLEKTALRERLDKVKAFGKKSNGKA
jgi:site-specific recombinase XerD